MSKMDIEYKQRDLTIDYTWNPEEQPSRDSPGYPEEVWINQVYYKGRDITKLLSEDTLADILTEMEKI